jgi:hypothetical protein
LILEDVCIADDDDEFVIELEIDLSLILRVNTVGNVAIGGTVGDDN